MYSKSSKWELGLFHYTAKFTITRFISLRFFFFFSISNIHINRSWLCDGLIQCPVNAEDESFAICKDFGRFPTGATLICNETMRDHNITIKAISCDDIPECLDGSDEMCGEEIAKATYKIGIGLFFAIFLIWGKLYLKLIQITTVKNKAVALEMNDMAKSR